MNSKESNLWRGKVIQLNRPTGCHRACADVRRSFNGGPKPITINMYAV